MEMMEIVASASVPTGLAPILVNGRIASSEIDPFIILAVVAVLGFAAPFFAKALKLPLVVGEILFGVIIGSSLHVLGIVGLDIDLSSGMMDLLSTLGFITLMFMIGMENDFDQLRAISRREKLAILLVISANFMIALVPFLLLGLPLMVGLIVGGVSIAVVMPVLREMGIQRTGFGFKMMLIAQIADVAAIFLLSFSAASESGFRTVMILISIPLLFLILFWLADLLIWYKPHLMSRITNPTDQAELGVRATLAAVLIFYGLALFIGIEAVLGAFLCGMLFSAIFKERGAMMEKFMPLGYGFLIPIFFIYQGFSVSILDLFDAGALALLFLLLSVQFISKAIPIMVSKFFKRPWSNIGGSLLLGTNLSVVVAGVTIGTEAGILDERTSTVLILYGVTSCILFPMLFRKVFRKHLSDRVGAEGDPS